MTFRKINFYRVVSVMLTTLFSLLGNAQEAENLFHKDYSKLSFVFQPSILMKSHAQNNDGSTYPSMDFTNDFSWQFGFYYNFAQSGRFNFKTGLIAKEFISKFDLNVTKEDVGTIDEPFLTENDIFNQFIFSIPLKTDCYLNLSKKTNMVIGAGLNLNIVTGMNAYNIYGIAIIDRNGDYKDVFHSHSDSQNSLNISAEMSLGLNYKAKFALIDLSFFVNQAMGQEYASGPYKIFNLNQSPDKTGTFSVRNNYYGLSLAVSPKKGWLKKKY